VISVEEVGTEPNQRPSGRRASSIPELRTLLFALGYSVHVVTTGQRGWESGSKIEHIGTLTGARSNPVGRSGSNDVLIYLTLTMGSASSIELELREGDQITIAGFTRVLHRDMQPLNQKTAKIALSIVP